MRRPTWRSAVALLALAAMTACRPLPADPRCRIQPPPRKSYGQCFAEIGHYFDRSNFWCVTVSGCECDATCKQDELPFRTQEDCEATCLGSARDQLP
ncbi:MAG: hypothetical protein HY906_04760 [Deltaproteobacteria bacterium]|nr:hypothetical protein [Deltaproteobacteria bacterium]